MSSYLDWNAMGLTRSKTTHELHQVRMDTYQEAVDWTKRFIGQQGYLVLDARLDPELEMWRFHVGEDMYVNVPHDLIRRAQAVIEYWMDNGKR